MESKRQLFTSAKMLIDGERKVVCSEATLEALKWYVQFNVKQGPDDYIFQKQNGDKLNRNAILK
jgi:integrase/recombinase XerD